MNRSISNFLRNIRNITAVRVAVFSTVTLTFGVTANAQCGSSFSAMAAAADSVRNQSQISKSISNASASASDNSVNTSIVGLWHIRFLVGDQQIQEAYQIWNVGGTEVHNPNVDPRQGNVCLGAWREAAPQTFKLTHRVWLYDTNGNFQGVGHLTETVSLGDRGNTHSGTFTLDIYDLSGTFLVQAAAGTVVGERISPN